MKNGWRGRRARRAADQGASCANHIILNMRRKIIEPVYKSKQHRQHRRNSRSERQHLPRRFFSDGEAVTEKKVGRIMLVGPPGKSAEINCVDRACFHGGAPKILTKIVEKSRKQFRSPFLVRWLFSSSPIGSAPPSSSFGAHHLSCAPTTPPCHYTSLFRQSPSLAHFLRATRRVFGVPMENDELEANVIVVDDDVQATWLELVPGQHQLPQPAPPYGMSIVCCVEENGTTAVDNLPMVTVCVSGGGRCPPPDSHRGLQPRLQPCGRPCARRGQPAAPTPEASYLESLRYSAPFSPSRREGSLF